MPNKISLNLPPSSLNTPEMRELYSYLYQLIEQLNVCLGKIDDEQISGAMQEKLSSISGLGRDISKMGASTNETIVSAINQVNGNMETMNSTIRTDFANADKDAVEEAVNAANGYTDEQTSSAAILEKIDGEYVPATEFDEFVQGYEAFRDDVKDITDGYDLNEGTLEQRLTDITARLDALENPPV